MNEVMVTVVGNVVTDPVTRQVGEDARVVGFRVASSERRFDKATETWGDGDRFSAWVSCWRRLGEGVARSVLKGDPIVVTGRLSVREYEAGGERRYSTEIAATAVGHDLARMAAAPARSAGERAEDGTGSGGAVAGGGPERSVPAELPGPAEDGDDSSVPSGELAA